MKKTLFVISLIWTGLWLSASAQSGLLWLNSGDGYREVRNGEVVEVSLPDLQSKTLITQKQLVPSGSSTSLPIRSFAFSTDEQQVLIYTNTRRVWRLDTRGDYWVLNRQTGTLRQLGKGLPEASLMFAKFSPDGSRVAYVSGHNIYVEEISSGVITPLTTDGTDRVINGTFDWAYEEEFSCRDGFRWSPDSRAIAYWQIDASRIRNFLMINTTDSIYAFTVPVEYPKVGETPSPYKIGIVDIATQKTRWMNIPGNPQQTYVPRMEWAGNSQELVIQQLDRKQQQSDLLYIDTRSGQARVFYQEKDDSWIDIDGPEGWDWLAEGREFLWISERDGWRHAYRIRRDGQRVTLITPGDYDLISVVRIDEKNNALYFLASPDNATQAYLYRAPLDGKGKAERLSPADQPGTHRYDISANGKWARHTFSNARTRPITEWLSMPAHQPLDPDKSVSKSLAAAPPSSLDIEFFQVKTVDGVDIDAWMVRPANFDPSKKYPIVFTVYGEPASSTVRDAFGTGRNRLYLGDMAADGYIYASMDNRGTPSPKGRAWRKAIYRNIGRINIRDMAMTAQAMFDRFPFIDTSRVAVHGWSGGGSSTLNLLFQYPGMFKTGIAVAAVANQLTYDNIYQERYMGLPQENREDFIKGSPLTHAANLQGNLLYIHGTGDDNVHYQNTEMLINELVKHNKLFQLMAYPNRSHSISEGEGTSRHLANLFTDFLKKNCPPGPR